MINSGAPGSKSSMLKYIMKEQEVLANINLNKALKQKFARARAR